MLSKNLILFLVVLLSPYISTAQNVQDSLSNSTDILTAKGISDDAQITSPEEVFDRERLIVKSQSQFQPKGVPVLLTNEQKIKKINSIETLAAFFERELELIDQQLAAYDLEYRNQRVLTIKKEETETDLAFLERLEEIKEIIAYETTGNSAGFIMSADRFLDTLFHDDTEVSERFKDLSKERYDNYLAKDKIVKILLNNVRVEVLKENEAGEKLFYYSGFIVLPDFPKSVLVEFYSDGFVRKADRKLMYNLARIDNIDQEVTIEGVIENYQHGRVSLEEKRTEQVLSKIKLNEWIIMDREAVIKDVKKSNEE